MQFVTPQTFKTYHVKTSPTGRPWRQKDDGVSVGVRKAGVETVEKLGDRTIGFTISTGCVDRDMDMIDPKGWKLDNFRKNPVVLWSHRADELPIGKVVDIGRDDRRLRADVKFLPGGYGPASDLADTIYRMSADGYLSATSVGFKPIKWEFCDDPDRGGDGWFPGIDFAEQELVELSVVCVPSNPEALIDDVTSPLMMPGGGDQQPIIPAPVQIISYDGYRRRARAALVGVFPPR